MGQQRIKLKNEAADRLLQLATAVGMDYTRTASGNSGVVHYFRYPKQNREYKLRLQGSAEEGLVLRMDICPSCIALAERLAEEDLLA